MVKKTIILLGFIFFCSFTLLVCGEKNICQGAGAGCFWPLGAGAARKKIPGAGAPAWEKNQEPEPEPLEKKSGAGAAKKFAGSLALIFGHHYFVSGLL